MKKAFCFDFDDTLATTECKVRVVRNGSKLPFKRLTPAEYNEYEIEDLEYEYDFSEFRSEKFIRNANPTFLMALAQEVYKEGHSVYVLTARSDSVVVAITDFLLGHDVKPMKVFGVGSDEVKLDIAAEKKKVLETLCQAFDLVYFYDDCDKNCDLAREVGSGIKVYSV